MKREHYELINMCEKAMEEDLLSWNDWSNYSIPDLVERMAQAFDKMVDHYMTAGISYQTRRDAGAIANISAMIIQKCNKEMLSRMN